MKLNNQDLLRRFETMGRALLIGARVDMRKYHDMEREIIKRGLSIEKERLKNNIILGSKK
jgi:hypothetical protein